MTGPSLGRLDNVTIEEKMEAYSDRAGGPDACWPWIRSTDSSGYGLVTIPGRGGLQRRAHVVAWEIANDQQRPVGMEVLHSCDRPACVNPAHLNLGTHAENMREMSFRGRASVGERSGQAKLTRPQLEEIHALAGDGLTNREIASRYNVNPSTVSRILTGRRRPDRPVVRDGADRRRRKLSVEDVLRIQRLRAGGVRRAEIAKRYGLSLDYAGRVGTPGRRETVRSATAATPSGRTRL